MASKLYVGGLSYSTTSETLREYFAQCGTVESAAVITDKFSGQSRGFGFVEMATAEEAQRAISELNGKDLDGRKLTVNLKSRINWVWTDGSADVHDVKLISAPKGFKKFQTEPGSAGYTYSKTLTKPGVYKFICTLHEEDNMRMTITVRH